MSDVVLAIDAGGTKLLAGLVAETGDVVVRRQIPTPRAGERCDPGLDATRGLAHDLLEAAAVDGHRVLGIGLGFPEYVRDDEVTSREVFAWTEQPRDVLAALAPGLPVVVDGDVRCAAQAEGRARGAAASPLFYVSWGTGLSSTLVVDGHPWPGHRGEALAFGEWPVHPADGSTWDGNLETYASGLGMQRRYDAVTGRPPTAPVALLAVDGDRAADAVLTSATAELAGAIAQVVLVVDPAVVVLGGGIGGAGGEAVRRIRELVPTLLHRPDPPSVEPAVTGSDAGLVGAALLAWARVAS